MFFLNGIYFIKSTTMNILTGCLAATSGQVAIDGFDIYEDAPEALEEKLSDWDLHGRNDSGCSRITGCGQSVRFGNSDQIHKLRYDDGTWIRPDDDDFAVEQDTADSMLDAAANIGASLRITDVTDYSQYGLEEPQSRIVLEYAESDESDTADDDAADSQTSTIEILTGDYNDASGEYYARLAGDDSVYLVTGEYLEYFECTTDDLAAADDEEE